MSASIYYEAKRDTPLSLVEKQSVDEITEKFSMDKAIEQYMETGKGMNWESFAFWDEPHEPGRILNGSTKLPDNTNEAFRLGIVHWCSALTEVRRVIKGAKWDVRVEDHRIVWDETKQAYDPTK